MVIFVVSLVVLMALLTAVVVHRQTRPSMRWDRSPGTADPPSNSMGRTSSSNPGYWGP